MPSAINSAASWANARDARKAIDKLAAPTLKSVAAAVERANAAIEMLTAKTNPPLRRLVLLS